MATAGLPIPPRLGDSAQDESLLNNAALDDAATAIEKLLERPHALLDSSGDEAKSLAEGARSFVKMFFDAAQARCPPHLLKAADGLTSMVVDGFEPEQIWEELEVQNTPLRRHLRRSIKKLVSAPKGAVDISLSSSAVASSGNPEGKATRGAAGADVTSAKKKHRRKQAPDAKNEIQDEVAEGSHDNDCVGDVSDEEAVQQGTATAGDEPLEDGFFSLEDMNRFADLAEAPGGMRLDEDAEDSDDFGMLEGMDDGDADEEVVKKTNFADFFDPPEKKTGEKKNGKKKKDDVADQNSREKRRMQAMEAFDEDDDIDDDNEDDADEAEECDDLSEEERGLEAKLQELQAEGAASDDDEDMEEEEKAGDSEDEDEADKDGAGLPTKAKMGRSLYEMDKNLRSLEEEVSKLEEEQLSEKHWSLRGEVSAKQRPMNSLLEVSLDQPMSQLACQRAGDTTDSAGVAGAENEDLDDVPGADTLRKGVALDIDAIIRQRVWDETYDDVVRRAELPPSQRPDKPDADVVETLNFEKSRVGLGQVYEAQYEAEMLGNKTEAEQKEDKDKAETKELFAKVMFKLDQLTNAHFTPRPPTLGANGEQLQKVGSLKMEETIPLLMSDALLKAPEEVRAPRRHARERNELSHDERTAARRAKKTGRRKTLERRVESGEMSLAGMRERNEKLQEKNAEAKREKANVGMVKDAKKRLRSTELLSQAAQNAASGASRKDVAREERRNLNNAGSSLPSKKFKL